MVPRKYAALEGTTLPLTGTGKVDRRELERRLEEGGTGGAGVGSAASACLPLRGGLEKAVARAWGEALGFTTSSSSPGSDARAGGESPKGEEGSGGAGTGAGEPFASEYTISAGDHFGALGGNSLSALRACRVLASSTTSVDVSATATAFPPSPPLDPSVQHEDAAGMRVGEVGPDRHCLPHHPPNVRPSLIKLNGII